MQKVPLFVPPTPNKPTAQQKVVLLTDEQVSPAAWQPQARSSTRRSSQPFGEVQQAIRQISCIEETNLDPHWWTGSTFNR
jgi:hypothetical protein